MRKMNSEKGIDLIKKNLKTDKLVFGTKRTMKFMKLGKLKKVLYTTNTPADVVEDIDHYSKITEIEVERLDVPNDELGIICKKQFSISVVGLLG